MGNSNLKLELEIIQSQRTICGKYGAEYLEAPLEKIIGVALETFKEAQWPVNGLRHPDQTNSVINWYLWAGEGYSEEPDFFKPIHIRHLLSICPEALKYLGLAPGWRFLFDDKFEDVWYDGSLLNV